MERLTIAEAAKHLNLTQEAIRQRIRRGTIEHHKGEDGRTYVYLDTDPEETTSPQEIGNELTNLFSSQITSLEIDKEHLREENQRLQQIIMALSQKIPEPPKHEEQKALPSPKKMWRRIFK